MLRFIMFLLILAGLAAAGYGAVQYLDVLPDPQDRGSASQAEYKMVEAEPEIAALEMGDAEIAMPAPRSVAPGAGPGFDDDMVSITSAGDEMMDRLRTVPIAHETPSSAKFGRAFQVTVAIDATGDATAADALPGTGNIVEGEAQISSQVMAALSGEMFDIEAVTPMSQMVSPFTENVWRWRVTPTEVGAHELVIELFALEGGNALPVRTFRDRVEVQVSRVGQIIAAVDTISPVTMVIGGIGSFFAGLFGFFRLFKRG